MVSNSTMTVLQWVRDYSVNGSFVADNGTLYIAEIVDNPNAGAERRVRIFRTEPEPSVHRSILRIRATRHSDAGNYSCVVANSKGHDHRTATLLIVDHFATPDRRGNKDEFK